MQEATFPKTALGRYWFRLRARLKKRPVSVSTVAHDGSRFWIDVTYVDRCGKRVSETNWDKIQEIQVYKRDLLTVDLVCMLISNADGRCVEIHEEMEGWESLIAALPKYLPSCQTIESWWLDTVVPAFETNQRTIFSRDQSDFRPELP